jgi:hypothetical protein
VNDGFLGDVRISTVMPVAVTAPQDRSSFIASATPGHRDLYAIAPLGSTLLGVSGLRPPLIIGTTRCARKPRCCLQSQAGCMDVVPLTC